ncbi:MAG TPA: hypothetical protein VFN48_11300 [Solirubrobacteraceae bacterium]|nr:hypothetical protein [Solirubrobacteraceae bacterium]
MTTNRNWFVVGPGHTHCRTVHERVAATTLTLSTSASIATTGTPVTFTGTVFPAHRFQRVLIQAQESATGDVWRTVAVTRTQANSSFSVAHAFRDPGNLTLRALLPGDVRNIAGSSDLGPATASSHASASPGASPSACASSAARRTAARRRCR